MTNQDHPAHPIENTSDYWCGLTAREHAATQLRVPDSGTDWLDAMIRTSLRQEFAKAAMDEAMQVREGYVMDTEPNAQELARAAVQIADALLAELAKETKE